MPEPAERFRLPRTASGWSPRWLAVSVLVHAVVVWLWVLTNVPRAVPPLRSAPLLVVDLPGQVAVPAPPLPYDFPRGGRSTPIVLGRGVGPVTDSGLVPTAGAGQDSGAATGLVTGRPGTTLAAAVPQYGDGRVWVRPLYLPPGGGRPIRMDSVAAARMLALADSIERHPLADPNANPYVSRPWTFRRNGKTYGWDATGLHLGDFTIPNAILALLSMPQGNIDQSRANAALLEMRADIMRAAARAQAEEDFRRAVRDIRARKDRERREQRERDAARERLTP